MDDYELMKQLAKGGQGTTHVAKKKSTGQRIVIKQTQCENVRTGNDALREAKTLQGLKHHSVVEYLDVFLHSADGYLVVCTVMELCNRGDLANYLFDKRRRQSPLNEQVVRSWMGQLTDSLAYLHNLKIIHRDLKPHNVFLTKEGVLKVGDFGLSATIEHGKRTSHVGTPCYLAPEVMNHESYGEGVDMWGVGCIGFEMMTLDFLWERKGLLAATVKMNPLTAEQLPKQFSAALRECVCSCLKHPPASRPPAATLLKKIKASKTGSGDDSMALAKALEGFEVSDALNYVADSFKQGFESFNNSFKGLFGQPKPNFEMAKVTVREDDMDDYLESLGAGQFNKAGAGDAGGGAQRGAGAKGTGAPGGKPAGILKSSSKRGTVEM